MKRIVKGAVFGPPPFRLFGHRIVIEFLEPNTDHLFPVSGVTV